jgi:hypothetical protein
MENYIFQAKKCPLTGIEEPDLKYFKFEIPDEKFGKRGFQWFYPFNEEFLFVVEGNLFEDQKFWESNRTAIYYLIENGIWPKGKMVDKPLLEALVSSSGVPTTPRDKMIEVLHFISTNQKYFGEWVSIESKDYDSIIRKTGILKPDELEWIIRESANYCFLTIKTEHKQAVVVILSIKGWEIAELRNHDKDSKTVFVAMSFDPEMVDVFNGWIEPAIRECGFVAKMVLDDSIESDQTVNDAILAGIKKARFTIADFTDHRNGVYFEAGYALGRGQKVIYMCRVDHIENAHFDIRNYQHLVWKDGEDLKKKLMDKIEVFIKA